MVWWCLIKSIKGPFLDLIPALRFGSWTFLHDSQFKVMLTYFIICSFISSVLHSLLIGRPFAKRRRERRWVGLLCCEWHIGDIPSPWHCTDARLEEMLWNWVFSAVCTLKFGSRVKFGLVYYEHSTLEQIYVYVKTPYISGACCYYDLQLCFKARQFLQTVTPNVWDAADRRKVGLKGADEPLGL